MLLYYSLAVALPLLPLSYAASSSAAAQQTGAASSNPNVFNPPPGSTWPADLEGTWSTKSLSTKTGPGFYDPIKDEMIEPDLTGISYSFTLDGYYEEAFYRAIAAPSNPQCPEGLMQWQHGRYYMNATGSLILEPIPVDGRQLVSAPCDGSNSIYTRYNQTEVMKQYAQYLDPFHGVQRLDLFEFDGTPMPPMYLVYKPPEMLPTTTLNPLPSSTSGTSTATGGSKMRKRSLDHEVPLNWKAKLESSQQGAVVHHINADRLWWIGLGMTGVGGLLYLGPRRMGIQL